MGEGAWRVDWVRMAAPGRTMLSRGAVNWGDRGRRASMFAKMRGGRRRVLPGARAIAAGGSPHRDTRWRIRKVGGTAATTRILVIDGGEGAYETLVACMGVNT